MRFLKYLYMVTCDLRSVVQKMLHGINIRNPEDRSLENLVFYHEVLGAFFFSWVKKIIRNNGLGKRIFVGSQKLVLFSNCIYFVLFIFVNILGLN